jgi:hypothetical protein
MTTKINQYQIKGSPNAAGDGVTDDTNALNAWIASINAGTIQYPFLPAATYLCGPLTPVTATGVTIMAYGATLKSKANTNTTTNTAMFSLNGNYSGIVGATFDGNQAAYSAGNSAQVLGTNGIFQKLDSVTVKNSPGRGLINGSSNSSFINCHFDDNANLGMEINGTAYNAFTNCTWNRNGYGFKGTRAYPSSNTSSGSAFGFAIRFRSHHMTFVSCTANDNGKDGMNLNQGSYAMKFIGCEASRNDDGGFTIASDNTAPGEPGNAESCYDIEYVDCEAANNWTCGLVAYSAAYNVTVTGGRYYNNNRVAGLQAQESSFYSGIYFAGGSISINIDTKAYDDRQEHVITVVSGSGTTRTLTAPGWTSGTMNYYPRVAIYDGNHAFLGYGNITSEATDSVTIESSTFNGVALGSVVATQYVSQRVQHNGVFTDNNCQGEVHVDGFGFYPGPTAGLQGFLVMSGYFANGQNIRLTKAQRSPTQLLLNPTFDTNTTNWTPLAPAGSSFAINSSIAKSPNSARIAGGTSLANYADGDLITDGIKFAAGSFVEFSAWVWCESRGAASIQLLIEANPWATTVNHPGGGWSLLTISAFTTGTTYCIPRLIVSAGQVAYFDNLDMRAVQIGNDNRNYDYPTRALPY